MHLGGIITVDCSFTIQKLIMKTIAVADYINAFFGLAENDIIIIAVIDKNPLDCSVGN
jgi:hypothetical protein